MRYKANELKYERVRILGKIGFFTNERIQKDSVPERVFQYEVRHDDLCQGIPCEVAKGILVNFWGTILTREEMSDVISCLQRYRGQANLFFFQKNLLCHSMYIRLLYIFRMSTR